MNTITLEALNAADARRFVEALGAIYEHSPWVAEAIAAKRPNMLIRRRTAGMIRHPLPGERKEV